MSDAALMDRIYGWQTGIYDVTRKPYLLGRDRLIASLAPPVGGQVLEIGDISQARRGYRRHRHRPTSPPRPLAG